jgi:hypothetical protein
MSNMAVVGNIEGTSEKLSISKICTYEISSAQEGSRTVLVVLGTSGRKIWFANMVAYTYFFFIYVVFYLYSENLENVLDVCFVNNILFSDLRISFLRIIRKCL